MKNLKLLGWIPYLAIALPILFLSTLTACRSVATISDRPEDRSSVSIAQSTSVQSMYQPDLGSYPVGEVNNLTLNRGSRQLPLKVYYPQRQGTFPTIIFSHGAGSSNTGYSSLASYWASHGYVVILPTHADSLALQGESADSGNLREIVESMTKDSQGWIDRVGDLRAIADSLSQLPQQAPELRGKIDPQHLGVGGHSYGAYTAQLSGGATIDIPGRARSENFRDRRVQAILLLSPQGRGQQGLTSSSWNNLNLPMMVMTGSRDRGAQGQGPEWKQEPFELAPPGDKYLVFIQGANHFSFSGRLAAPEGLGGRQRNRRFGARLGLRGDQEAIFDDVKIATLAFWDAYLKQETQGRSYLRGNSLQQQSEGRVAISTK
ncbi:MAG: hypothetical protein SAJ37_02605 [Oscillatoria sp. PMC 1068.18]|nr:hypothetical protein [Oscillatoria sp. PMC 1076.18]MEC4987613.1 hypothetical protein [Oscillatoria sp. PMC 1068.18]